MKTRNTNKLSLITLIIFFGLFGCYEKNNKLISNQNNSNIIKINAEFAIKIYNEFKNSNNNIFFSPYAVLQIMGITYVGSKENTAKEMAKVLNFSSNKKELLLELKSLNDSVNASTSNDLQLNAVNGLILTSKGIINNEFKTLLKNNFNAQIFFGELNIINNWVKQETNGNIPNILQKLSPNSVCTFLNAIYFKSSWKNQFQLNKTTDSIFNLADKKQVSVPFMYLKSDFKILDEENFRAISIPYKGNDLSMIILLPKEIDGINNLEKILTVQHLKQWSDELNKQAKEKVEIYLPKFKLSSSYDLIPNLKKLGINDAFTPNIANFSGMINKGLSKTSIWISQIKHKAYIDVNEKGTVASAATAVEMQTRSLKYYPVFRIDHPFIFIIQNNHTENILFMGRQINPTK